MIPQAEDLGGTLGGTLRGKDGATAETCREGGSGWRVHMEQSEMIEEVLHSPLGIWREDQISCAAQSGVRGGQLMTG